jgi:surface protein
MVHLNKNETDWTWTWNDKLAEIDGTRYFIAWATYTHVLPAGEHTKISLSQIALDFSAINEHSRAFGEKYEVKAFAQGIQADGFDSASAAIAKGFDDTIPFKNCKVVEFTDLKTALKYLNGEKSDANKITDKVQTITFGLTKDYAAKVEGHEGVLVANLENQADFTAYTYYVPTADDKYDIYVLADNWKIYTPNNSSLLFSGMTALTTVNTANMDVSHTTNMLSMFDGCSNLVDIDVGNWDTSNVTTMARMFNGCINLKTLEAGTWNVSNAQWIYNMFYSCSSLRVLDLSNWNTTNVTSCASMFANCTALTTIYVGDGWDLSNVKLSTNSTDMFKDCTNLPNFDSGKVDKTNAHTGEGGYLTKK